MDINKIHIIAEAGSNHNGSIVKAKNLISIAKEANADSVKFQLINTWGLYLPGNYEYGHYKIHDILKFREQCEFKDKEFLDLKQFATQIGISFSASVFDNAGLELLIKTKPPYIKISSSDLNNTRFLKQIGSKGMRTILSTGMSSLNEIERAVNILNKSGCNDIIIMHCVSIYPATLQQTQLRFIKELKDKFGYPVGFSDHTKNSNAACMALALGATWFEKHFTESNKQQGLDHKHALEPKELKEYIKDLHDANFSLFNVSDKVSESEIFTKKRARRSLYASRDIEPGEIIQSDDVLCVRPENIMSADQIEEIIGKKIKSKIKKYDPFTLDNF